MDLYPLIVVLPRADAELPLASPVTLPELQSPDTEDIQDKPAEQCVVTMSSADTSLSITGHAANMDLMTLPLIPLPDTITVPTDTVLPLELTKTYQDQTYQLHT